jgi:hypothetical protein
MPYSAPRPIPPFKGTPQSHKPSQETTAPSQFPVSTSASTSQAAPAPASTRGNSSSSSFSALDTQHAHETAGRPSIPLIPHAESLASGPSDLASVASLKSPPIAGPSAFPSSRSGGIRSYSTGGPSRGTLDSHILASGKTPARSPVMAASSVLQPDSQIAASSSSNLYPHELTAATASYPSLPIRRRATSQDPTAFSSKPPIQSRHPPHTAIVAIPINPSSAHVPNLTPKRPPNLTPSSSSSSFISSPPVVFPQPAPEEAELFNSIRKKVSVQDQEAMRKMRQAMTTSLDNMDKSESSHTGSTSASPGASPLSPRFPPHSQSSSRSTGGGGGSHTGGSGGSSGRGSLGRGLKTRRSTLSHELHEHEASSGPSIDKAEASSSGVDVRGSTTEQQVSSFSSTEYNLSSFAFVNRPMDWPVNNQLIKEALATTRGRLCNGCHGS